MTTATESPPANGLDLLLAELVEQKTPLTHAQLQRMPAAPDKRYAFLRKWHAGAKSSDARDHARDAIEKHERIRGGGAESFAEKRDRQAAEAHEREQAIKMMEAQHGAERQASPGGQLVGNAQRIIDDAAAQARDDYARLVMRTAKAGPQAGDDTLLARLMQDLNLSQEMISTDIEAAREAQQLQTELQGAEESLAAFEAKGLLERKRTDAYTKLQRETAKLKKPIAAIEETLEQRGMAVEFVRVTKIQWLETKNDAARVFGRNVTAKD